MRGARSRCLTPAAVALSLSLIGSVGALAQATWESELALGRKLRAEKQGESADTHMLAALAEADKLPASKRPLAVSSVQIPLMMAAYDNLMSHRPAGAERIYKALYEVDKTTYGADSVELVDRLHSLGQACVMQKKLREAKSYYDEALAIGRAKLPAGDRKLKSLEDSAAIVDKLKAADEAAGKAGVPATKF